MRKHFLILMLMALLPLAGWAEDEPVAPEAKTGLVYDGSNQTLVTAGVAHAGKAYYYALVAPDAPNPAAAPAGSAYGEAGVITAIKGTNAGTYKVYYVEATAQPTGDTAPTGATSFTVTIAKKLATVTINATAFAAAAYHRVYGWKPADFAGTVITTAKGALTTGEDFSDFVSTADKTAALNNIVINWGPEEDDVYYAAGEHTFTLSFNSMPNYIVSLSPSTGKWYVDKKDLIISADATTTLTYGDVFDETAASTHVTYNGFVDGEDEKDLDGELGFTSTYDAAVPAKSGVGTYSWSPSGQTSDNYNITYNNGIIVVEAKDITDENVKIAELADVTYNKTDKKPTAVTATYLTKTLEEGADKDYQLSYYSDPTIDEETGEITNAGTELTGDNAKIIDAGTYCVKVTANVGGNYTGEVLKKFVVKKKPIGIRTVNKEVTYNGANQASVVTFANNVEIAGLEEGDAYPGIKAATSADLGIHLEKEGVTVTEAKDAGTYDIKFNDYSGVKFKNYDFSGQISNQGQLTIEQKTIILTANNKSKNYGTPDVYVTGRKAVEEDVTVSYPAGESAITGHTISSYPWLQRAEGEEKADYDLNLVENDDNKLVIKSGETDVTKNYKPQFVPGTFTIGAGVIAIWANTQTITYGKTYGEAKAMLNASIDGMPKKDAEKIQAQVNAALTIKGVSEDLADDDLLPANPAGYDIKFNGEITIPEDLKPNYGEVYYYDISSKFKVNKKALTKITANTQPLYVGEAQSALVADENTITIEGALEGDIEDILAALDGTLKFAEHVNDNGAADPVLTAVPLADVAGKFVKATNTYLKGIEFNAAVDLGNYLFPADEENIVAGNLIVTANADVFTLDATKTDNATKINGIAGQKRDVVIKGRTLQANKWNALSLPFSISVRDLSKALGYAIVDRFQQTGDKLSFKIFIGQIPAYTPFLVKVDEAVDMKNITFEDVVVKATKTVTEENDTWKFINTVDKGVVDGLVYYITPSKSESAVYLDHRTSPELMGFYAYFKTQTGQPVADARIYIEEPDGSTTAISSINADGVAVKAEGWYTIDGIRLQGAPTEKGIYINNGKKIVVK